MDMPQLLLSFLPDFIVKTTQLDMPDGGTRTPFTIPALAPTLPSDHPDHSLCPVRALWIYLERTKADPHRKVCLSYKTEQKFPNFSRMQRSLPEIMSGVD